MNGSTFNSARIADSVHATIGISELEQAIIQCQSFIRLQHIRHLGLAYQVFPGAGYSRFSHSLGACHIMGRALDSLTDIAGIEIETREKQKYRLAALLHDVGHYPFSHTLETPIKNYYSQALLQSEDGQGNQQDLVVPEDPTSPTYYNHEKVGQIVITKDSELTSVITDAGYDPEEIAKIINRETDLRLANLISSDLDVDRIDYLLRTSHHTGLPYGNPDLEYLLSQIELDDQGQVCFSPKALRTIDHFLLSRYFDYQQVAFHKTVVALEWALQEAMTLLLKGGEDCSASGIESKVCSKAWRSFDDSHIIESLRKMRGSLSGTDQLIVGSVLDRNPARLVWSWEQLGRTVDSSTFELLRKMVNESKGDLASKYGIDERCWLVWTKDLPFTKIGTSVQVGNIQEELLEDGLAQAVRISIKGGSKPIMNERQSLMSVLSDVRLRMIRVYALLEDSDSAKSSDKRRALEKELIERFTD